MPEPCPTDWQWSPFPEPFEPEVGGEVYVTPRSRRERENARATVEELPDADHAVVRRCDGSRSRVRRARLTRVLPRGDAARRVVVCADTASFRRLADSQPSAADAGGVVELGSSYGDATARLARAAGGAARVLGLETSPTVLAAAEARWPELRFERLDCVTEKDALAARVAAAACVFVDLDGDRVAATLLVLLSFLQRAARACRLLAVKSEQLHAALPARADERAAWWARALEAARASTAAAGAQMRGVTLGLEGDASLGLRHPLRYPRRYARDAAGREVEICRYHNYRVCHNHRDGACARDHTRCHVCGRPGHIALACRTFAEPCFAARAGEAEGDAVASEARAEAAEAPPQRSETPADEPPAKPLCCDAQVLLEACS